MSKVDRVMLIVRSMSDDERAELVHTIDCEYCVSCGIELPERDEPAHDCPYGDDEDDDDDEEDERDSRTSKTSIGTAPLLSCMITPKKLR